MQNLQETKSGCLVDHSSYFVIIIHPFRPPKQKNSETLQWKGRYKWVLWRGSSFLQLSASISKHYDHVGWLWCNSCVLLLLFKAISMSRSAWVKEMNTQLRLQTWLQVIPHHPEIYFFSVKQIGMYRTYMTLCLCQLCIWQPCLSKPLNGNVFLVKDPNKLLQKSTNLCFQN